MNKRILVLLLCWVSFSAIYAQGHNPNLAPEDTLSFIKLKLTNPDGSPYANSPVTLKGIKGHVVKVTTGKDGRVKAKVPFDETYTVHCGESTCMRTITLNAFPYVTYNYQAYTRRFIYFTFTYRNRFNERILGEEVTLHSSTGEKYTGTTNAEGQAVFYLPFDAEFRIEVRYHENVKTIRPQDVGKEYKIMSTVFTWMGAKEKERLAYVADSLSRAIHLNATKFLDSLIEAGAYQKLAEEDIYIPIDYDSIEWVQKMLEAKGQAYLEKWKEDADYFMDNDKTVLAPLSRLQTKFKHQVIVTDITGSMYRYLEEVMLWHALNFMGNDHKKKYLFFNDGDHKKTEDKIIGSTGGFYFCQGQIKDFTTVLRTMRKGIRNGEGGELPENDIEALLAAQGKRSKYDEIILIADNYSPVRDLGLMKKLNCPIRIVLCRAGDGRRTCWRKNAKAINEEYIDLAYKTGGSIHLIDEDIYDLEKLKEGESIKIRDQEFRLINGHFVFQEKL